MEKKDICDGSMKNNVSNVQETLTTARQTAKRRSLYNGFPPCQSSCLPPSAIGRCQVCHSLTTDSCIVTDASSHTSNTTASGVYEVCFASYCKRLKISNDLVHSRGGVRGCSSLIGNTNTDYSIALSAEMQISHYLPHVVHGNAFSAAGNIYFPLSHTRPGYLSSIAPASSSVPMLSAMLTNATASAVARTPSTPAYVAHTAVVNALSNPSANMFVDTAVCSTFPSNVASPAIDSSSVVLAQQVVSHPNVCRPMARKSARLAAPTSAVKSSLTYGATRIPPQSVSRKQAASRRCSNIATANTKKISIESLLPPTDIGGCSSSTPLDPFTTSLESDLSADKAAIVIGTESCYVENDRDDFYEYVDIGDCREQCNHCQAAFWYNERLNDKTKDCPPVYHGCCAGGKVGIPQDADFPQYMKTRLRERHFLENIRAYNQMFAMTSFGARIDDTINNGRSPYVFKLSGQVYHWIGSLCPDEGDCPRFLQLYIYNTQHEVANRMRHFTTTDGNSTLNPDIVQELITLFDTHNVLIRLFRTARDRCMSVDIPDFKIRLYNLPGVRGYELPSSDSVGAVVFDSGPMTCTDYDVVIEMKGGHPQRINKLHPSYMSLQFPLLFVYGQHGYHTGLKMRTAASATQRTRLSMNAYYNYQLHERPTQYSPLFESGRLFQQYIVSVYCCIEQNRMDFLRANQNDIRRDYLSGVYDAISRGEREGSEIGSRVILPSSFTGGSRYMYSHYLDVLAICRDLGNPQFFITFTCNVRWPEIRRHMTSYPELTPNDRADVVSRVFQQKVRLFVKYLRKQKPFGTVSGVLYTIEFHKRGLPHCHTLLWLDTTSRIQQAQDVDKFISAEIPNPDVDGDGYKIISELMIHGPCGSVNPRAPCMQDGRCSTKFPKKYNSHSYFDKDGHIHYRRRDIGISVMKHSIHLDNTYVVPYNRLLSVTFYAHINVEYCNIPLFICL